MSSLHKYFISFFPPQESIEILPGTNVLDAARIAGIRLVSACGGNGKCGKCRVVILEGEVSPLKPQELKALKNEEIKKGYRLACCAYALGDLKINIPERSLESDVRLQLYGLSEAGSVDPVIESYDLRVKPATLEAPIADMDRVMEGLKDHIKSGHLYADIGSARQLPPLLRANDWRITSYVRSGEIIGFAPQSSPSLGVAIDLGTTKIAAYLMDIVSGRQPASLGLLNPQTVYGEDVMTRLRYAIKNSDPSGKSSGKLTSVVRGAIREVISGLVEKAGESLAQVTDICIVGNTAMIHLLVDLPVGQLAASPYVALVKDSIDIKARELDIAVAPGAYVHILPGIGGFVGPDHVAMIMAAEIDHTSDITLGIDIGTNTEIIINRSDKNMLISTSCASGPAFEGAHVTDGMRAMGGAIEYVRLTEKDVQIRTIGDGPAMGLCGSGIIDLVAELYKWDIIDKRGRFLKTNKRIREGRDGPEFEVFAGTGKKGDGRVVITQKDINEIQLAKGAIRAGVEALMDVTDTTPEMVEEVILAGAFGSYINIASAVDMGLLPFFPNGRYKQIGNAAGMGAKMALLSKGERSRAQQIAERTEYLELTTYRNFKRLFAKGMMLPKKMEDG